MTRWGLLALAACSGPVEDASTDTDAFDPTAAWVVGDGPLVEVSGRVHAFGPSGGLDVEGAVVSVMEDPSLSTTVVDGTFALRVPSGAPLSFVMEKEGFLVNQSATLDVGPDGVQQVGFQAPVTWMGDLLAQAAGIAMDPDRCQIASTVSASISPPFGGAGVGEPGAVVALLPELPEGAVGPVYFAYISDAMILPDPTLTETSIDGGVLFANVPTGEYHLEATKEGVTFTAATLRCRAGVLVNAAPPWGLEFVE